MGGWITIVMKAITTVRSLLSKALGWGDGCRAMGACIAIPLRAYSAALVCCQRLYDGVNGCSRIPVRGSLADTRCAIRLRLVVQSACIWGIDKANAEGTDGFKSCCAVMATEL